MNVSVGGIFFMQFTDGMFLANVVDQNDAAGHCVFIDAYRKVIINPANEKEIFVDPSELL